MRSRLLPFVLAAATLVSLDASAPVFWSTMTSTDFLRGDAAGVSIDTLGRVTLGPGAKVVADLDAAAAWRMVAAPDGSVYVAAGNDGRVFQVDASGGSRVVYDAVETQVHAIAVAPDGALLAASSPDGRVVKVGRDGAVSTVFDPDERYVWAVASSADGTVHVATGDKAAVYRIPPGGPAMRIYASKAAHVTALAPAPDGGVYIGTDTPGQVIRLAPDGKPFVLLDSAHREIRAIRVGPAGELYVAAMTAKGQGEVRAADPPPASAAGGAVAAFSTEITVTASPAGQATPPPGPAATVSRGQVDRRDSKGAVYRIAPDGASEVLWDAADDLPYDLELSGDSVIVATAARGRLVRVSQAPTPEITLLTRLDAQQVTAIARGRGTSWWVLGSNPGRLWTVGTTPGTTGTLESEVRDSGSSAAWGTIRWSATTPAGTSITFQTRSGSAATPDETWSAWSPAYREATGQPVASPRGRYVQWRATLTGTPSVTPTLTGVTLAYLPRNTRPTVSGITVHPAGIVFQRPYSTGEFEIAGIGDALDTSSLPSLASMAPARTQPAVGRKAYQQGFRTIQWKGDDDADDKLTYAVSYRREGDSAWTPLRRDVQEEIVAWDTSSVPDGTYAVRIVASDDASNAPGTALSGAAESAAFEVDNTAPTVDVDRITRMNGTYRVAVRVRDAQSPLDRVEYSLDGLRWTRVFASDGIADSRTEAFAFEADASKVAAYGVRVRATDTSNNVRTITVSERP